MTAGVDIFRRAQLRMLPLGGGIPLAGGRGPKRAVIMSASALPYFPKTKASADAQTSFPNPPGSCLAAHGRVQSRTAAAEVWPVMQRGWIYGTGAASHPIAGGSVESLPAPGAELNDLGFPALILSAPVFDHLRTGKNQAAPAEILQM